MATNKANQRAHSASRSGVSRGPETRAGGARARGARTYNGTASRTSSRASIDPMSRLDLIADLAQTLAHGASVIRYPAALDRFYAALAANTAQPASLPVRVLQFGDSHTAADMFTGEARRVFQGQFGNGGVGFTYAGHPFAGYRILGSSRSQSPGWTTLGTHFTALGDALLGLGGVAISTYGPGESAMIDTPCTSFELQYLQQPGGGPVQITENGAPIATVDTSAPSEGAAYGGSPAATAIQPPYGDGSVSPAPSRASNSSTQAAGSWRYDCPSGTYSTLPHHFVFTTLTDAPVRLLGTVALQPGVTWESIGINGAEAPLLLRWNQPLFQTYLAHTAASLVVLAYGTNEAAAKWTYEEYTASFTRLIDTLHRVLPGASVLVLGPGDRSTAVRRHGYSTFAGTERILEAQRDVCRTHDCTFWDWQARMGGMGSMQRWVLAGWAQPDHTHLTGEGYRTLADALMADLLSGYDAYRISHGLPATPLRGAGVQGSAPAAIPPLSPQ